MRPLVPVLMSVLTVSVAARQLGQYCKFNARLYKYGSSFKYKCNKCHCGGHGEVFCSDMNCVCSYRGTLYPWGKSWRDGCRQCKCWKGNVKCKGCECMHRRQIYQEGEKMPNQGSRCCYCQKRTRVCKRTYCR